MNNIFRNITILLLPFLVMVVVNEYCRSKETMVYYAYMGYNTINGDKPSPDKCNWNCHNTTLYCKNHHVKRFRNYMDEIDPVYFGMIASLKGTGDYALANVAFLVVIWPMLMFFLVVKILQLKSSIKKIRTHDKVSN